MLSLPAEHLPTLPLLPLAPSASSSSWSVPCTSYCVSLCPSSGTSSNSTACLVYRGNAPFLLRQACHSEDCRRHRALRGKEQSSLYSLSYRPCFFPFSLPARPSSVLQMSAGLASFPAVRVPVGSVSECSKRDAMQEMNMLAVQYSIVSVAVKIRLPSESGLLPPVSAQN